MHTYKPENTLFIHFTPAGTRKHFVHHWGVQFLLGLKISAPSHTSHILQSPAGIPDKYFL